MSLWQKGNLPLTHRASLCETGGKAAVGQSPMRRVKGAFPARRTSRPLVGCVPDAPIRVSIQRCVKGRTLRPVPSCHGLQC